MTKLLKNIRSNFVFQILGGISGLSLYALMVYVDGLRFLGLFNQVLAVHIVLSQFGTLGLQFAMQQRIAANPDDKRSYASAGLLLVLCSSGLFSLLLAGLADWLGGLFESAGFATLLLGSLPAFFFLNLNKVLLGINNGLNQMTLFGFIFGLRPCLYLVFYLILTLLLDTIVFGPIKIVWVLGLAEIALCLIMLVKMDKSLLAKPRLTYLRDSSLFGLRSCMMGVFTELNTRVDVLCLGFFLSDRIVGIYSMSLAVYEGVLQALTIVRNNINPILAAHIKASPLLVKDLVMNITRWTYPAAVGLVMAAFITYGLTSFYFPAFKLLPSLAVLLVLLLGVMLVAGLFPFGAILIQAGRPGIHSVISFVAFVANFALNLWLIPVFGLYGAAFATSLTLFISHLVYFKIYNKCYAVNLWSVVWPLHIFYREKS